jgi:hypothetical protein
MLTICGSGVADAEFSTLIKAIRKSGGQEQ